MIAAGLLSLLNLVLNFFFPKKDQREEERKDGERMGRAEVNAEISGNELQKAKEAADAGNAVLSADPDRLRDPRPGDRKWDPDGLG